jgi:hypothetical protein
MDLYGSLWLSMALYGSLWLSAALYGSKDICGGIRASALYRRNIICYYSVTGPDSRALPPLVSPSGGHVGLGPGLIPGAYAWPGPGPRFVWRTPEGYFQILISQIQLE